MALVKPIAQGISAFDATKEQIFSFSSNGGDQVVANKLTIRLQDDNSIVYQNKIESYRFEQTVPSGTLTNNNYYNFYFNTYDVNGNESEDSNTVQFYCFTMPTLTFTNLPLSNLIEASSYSFNVSYNQIEGELLNYLKFYLYDSLNDLVSESGFYYGQSTLPNIFSHTFNGFENNTNYRLEVVAQSVHGMTVNVSYNFTARYYYPQMFSLLDLQNICDKGYVKIESNVIIVDGETPEKPKYIDSTYLDVHEYEDWVQWTQGFSIEDLATITIYMKVGKLGKFAIFGTEENGFVVSLIREIPYGESGVKDRFELNGYVGGVQTVHQTSNYVDILNQKSYYQIWIRKIDNDYDLRLTVLQRGIDIMEWDNSNIEYERISDFTWTDEEYNQGTEFIPMAEDIEEIFPLTSVKLFNGIYDNFDITRDVTSTFTTDKPTWTYDTRIDCNFNDNISGGNINTLLSALKYVKIKRRKKGTFDWVTLKQYEINKIEDLLIVTEDYYSPTDYDSEYAIVPVLEGEVEGTYIINGIKTKFNHLTIVDKDDAFNLIAQISYSGDTKNAPMGTYLPLHGMYPIIQKNSELEYWSGSITATLLGYNFEETKKIDRNDVINQVNDFCEFLNNMKAKIIKDWNGKINLVRFIGNPTVSYISAYGNGVAQVTMNWVEQGKFDNQQDLYNNGLTDAL